MKSGACDAKRPTVAHFVFRYLFGTGGWIHDQLVHMRRFRPIVLTDGTKNLGVFPFEPIYAYEDASALHKALLCLWKGRLRGAREPFFEWVLRRQRPCLLHSHFGTGGVEMLELKRRSRLPMVTTFYGADMSEVPRDPVWRRRYERLFSDGDLFLVEGNAMRRSLLELGCPGDRVVVQRLGVDLDALPFVERKPDPSGLVKILVAGTFREKKGIPDALRAVERVRRTYSGVEVTLIGDSAGKAGDEEEKKRILRLAAQLDGAVTWLRFVPPPAFRAALLEHHVFLSPSVTAKDGDSEGGAPVSLIEAQASGMPVVATFHSDIPEIVVDGKTGFLSPERDVDALAENLERLVAEPDLWGPMGQCGRAHVEENHDVRKQVGRLEEVYSGLVSSV